MERKDKDTVIATILDAVIACKIEVEGRSIQTTQIAAKARMSTRTLNRYFPNKDIMIFEAAVKYLNGRYDEIIKRYEASVDTTKLNGLERLNHFMNVQINDCKQNPVNAMLFVDASIYCISIGSEHKLRKPGFGGTISRIVVSCLESGIQDGSIKSTLSPQKTCILISSNFNGLMQRIAFIHKMSPELFEAECLFELLDEYVTMLNLYLKP